MNTYIALLRGINVGGHRRIKMADLKILLSELDFHNIETYIQSGNIVFDSTEENMHTLEKSIHIKINDTYGYDVAVFVLDHKMLVSIIKNNPYSETPDYSCFTFLSNHPDINNVKLLELACHNKEDFDKGDKLLYLYLPNGFAKTKLTNNLIERKLNVFATSRNWKTVNKLFDMTKNRSI